MGEHRLDDRAERLLELGRVLRPDEPEEGLGLGQGAGLRLVLRQALDESRGPHQCVVRDPRHGRVPAPAVLTATTAPVSWSVQARAPTSSTQVPVSPAVAVSVVLPGRWWNSRARSTSERG